MNLLLKIILTFKKFNFNYFYIEISLFKKICNLLLKEIINKFPFKLINQ
jgi:hypothetical protein